MMRVGNVACALTVILFVLTVIAGAWIRHIYRLDLNPILDKILFGVLSILFVEAYGSIRRIIEQFLRPYLHRFEPTPVQPVSEHIK